MSQLNLNAQQQLKSKDEMMKNLQGKLHAFMLKLFLDDMF
jgi:hypothetical protein